MHEVPDFESCSVCGRTILRGERISEYVLPDFQRVGVCALCKPRAEAAGWIPEAMATSLGGAPPPRRGRGVRLREALSRYTERTRGVRTRTSTRGQTGATTPSRRAPAGPSANGEPTSPRAPTNGETAARGEEERGAAVGGQQPERPTPEQPEQVGQEPPEQVGQEQHEPPAREQRQRPTRKQRGRGEDASEAAPRTVPRLMRIAVEGFNRSAEPRKVAGLIRSLGEPGISVKAIRGVQGPVLITVAWELAWYQWEVVVNEGSEAVSEVASGKEIAELPEPQRRWNAVAKEDGTLRLQWHTPPPGLPQ